jgi:hypothetical protein
MTEADARLKGLFAMDEPPARDAGFQATVMEQVLRRRFLEDVVMLCVASLAGAAVLWLFWRPLQAGLVAVSQGLAPAMGVLAALVFGWMILSGRPARAFLLES